MYKVLGGVLIALSFFWGIGTLMLYSDSFLSGSLTELNFFGCILVVGIGIFMVIKPKVRD